jgi:hypothetical protein
MEAHTTVRKKLRIGKEMKFLSGTVSQVVPTVLFYRDERKLLDLIADSAGSS